MNTRQAKSKRFNILSGIVWVGVIAVVVVAFSAIVCPPVRAGEGVDEELSGSPDFEREVRVTEKTHRSGEYTVQDAFDDLDGSGGVVKLGPGSFELDRATTPNAPIRITGSGPKSTALTGRIALILAPSPHVEVTDLLFRDLYRGAVLTEKSGYGHVKFDGVHFKHIEHKAIRGGVPGPIGRITVANCRFEDVRIGAGFRNGESRRMRIRDNVFLDVGERPVVLGSGSGDNRYAEVTGNLIDGVGPGRHPIGILSYVDRTTIRNNTIRNIQNDGGGRHEAISSRGSHTEIQNNTLIDAGGHTAAISLASNGPTTIKNNVIRFTDDHRGDRDAIDCRQTGLRIEKNRIFGSEVGINLRRGGRSRILRNYIGDSAHQSQAIVVSISTGSAVSEDVMSDVTIDGNKIAGIRHDRRKLYGIRFNIRNHAADHDTRMDDVNIINNVFRDIHVSGTSIGVFFGNVHRADSGMRNVSIRNNDLRALDVPIHRNHRHVENLLIGENPGFEGR